MKTAVDSSVLLAVFNDEPPAAPWVDLLIGARREGQLVVCEVVYAELSSAFPTVVNLEDALRKLGVTFEPISTAAAWQAGVSFRAYRNAGGPRKHLIPDFLIAAHAQVQADRLAASDRGYLRSCFPNLTVIHP